MTTAMHQAVSVAIAIVIMSYRFPMDDAILDSSHLMDGKASYRPERAPLHRRTEPLPPYELPLKCKYEPALNM